MLRIVIWILLLAAVVYAVLWVMDRRARKGRRPGGGASPAKPKPRGPDDDDDFLRDLEWRRQRDQRRPPVDPDHLPDDPPAANN